MWHWGLIAAAIKRRSRFACWRRSEAMIDMDGLREAVAMVKAGRSPRSAESSATWSIIANKDKAFSWIAYLVFVLTAFSSGRCSTHGCRAIYPDGAAC